MPATRQLIVDALETRLKGIATFTTVEVWRSSPFGLEEMPALNIRDTTDAMPYDGIGTSRRDHALTVELEVSFSGSTSAAAARQIIADVIAALGSDETFGGLAFETLVDAAEMSLEELGKILSVASINLTIRYRSEKWTI